MLYKGVALCYSIYNKRATKSTFEISPLSYRGEGKTHNINLIYERRKKAMLKKFESMTKKELLELLNNKEVLSLIAEGETVDRINYEIQKFNDSCITPESEENFLFYFPEGIMMHDTVTYRANKIQFYINLAKQMIQTGKAPQEKRQGRKAPQRQSKKAPSGEKRATTEKTEFSPEFKSFLESKGFKENARGYRGAGEIIENTTKGFKCYFKSPLSSEDKHTKADLYTGTHTEQEIRAYLNK